MRKRTYPRPCTVCGAVLSEEGYYVKYKATGARFSECISCRNARGKEKRAENPEAARKYQRDYYAKHLAKPRKPASSRVTKEPRIAHGRDMERRKEMAKLYQQHNKDKRKIWSHTGYLRHTARYQMHLSKQRAARCGASGCWTVAEWAALCERFGNKCLNCGATGTLSPDHVVPFAKGGSNYIDNIQPLCWPCNLAKGKKVIDYRAV